MRNDKSDGVDAEIEQRLQHLHTHDGVLICHDSHNGPARALVSGEVWQLAKMTSESDNRRYRGMLDATLAELFTDARLNSLNFLDVALNSEHQELAWITDLARSSAEAPISFVTIIGKDGPYNASGWLPWDVIGGVDRPSLLKHACVHVAVQNEPLLINNLAADGVTADLSLLVDLGVNSYLGVPIVSYCGTVLGALCVADFAPHDWLHRDVSLLEKLAKLVVKEITDASAIRALESSNSSSVKACEVTPEGRKCLPKIVNEKAERLHKLLGWLLGRARSEIKN